MAWVAIGALLIGPVARVTMYAFAPEWRWSIGEAFPTIVDALATGGLLAMRQSRLANSRTYVRVLRSSAGAAVPVALVVLSSAMPHIAFSYTVGETLMNLLIALVIHRLVMFPELSAGPVLNTRAVAHVGGLSYSLYLWQQPFLNRHSATLLATFPLNIVLAIAAALLSYHLVERPALRIGRRAGSTDAGAMARADSRKLEAHAAAI